ncbi:MAG: CotH kinase family protein [Bacteroidales bacterium]|nr:CotH kinase family protein [Bacteroidales bacterium]
MKAGFLILLVFILLNAGLAQEGMDIPVVVVETNGGFPIPDEPKIKAHLKVIDNGPGQLNYASDSGNVYDGNAGIEIRGAYSATLPQKPYGFETRNEASENLNVSLLGLPEENDWILLANYNDKSFLRNALAGELFRSMGHYAPRTRHCEVVINNSYEGGYVLTEKIKRDRNRVDIARLLETENSGDPVTGGYIFKTDYYSSEDSWLSSYPPFDKPGGRVHFVYYYPKPDAITEEQKHYLRNFVNSFEEVLHGPGFKNSATGYEAYIDVNSFRDYFILSEVSRNVDAYKKSRYLFKDKESKGGGIHSGPPWDYDWAWKDIWDCYMFTHTDGSGWAYQVNDCDVWPTPPVYMSRLLQDEHFANNIRHRYESLRESVLSTENIFSYIDSVTNYLSEAQRRHYTRWDILGENVGAPEVGYIPTTFYSEIGKLKNWIERRLNWLDANMPGDAGGPLANPGREEIHLRLFPNPAYELVYIESNRAISKIEILPMSGAAVELKKDMSAFSTGLDISAFTPGLYLVQVFFEGGERISRKLIVH